MTRSTTMRLIGFGVVALSVNAACAASDDSGGGDDGGGNVLISGNTGGAAPGVPGTGVGGTDPGAGVGGTDPGAGVGGTTTGAGGTTSAEVSCTGTGWSFDAGYVDTGTLCGYGWTAGFDAGGTVDPACGDAPCFEESTSFCASASIPQGTAWVSEAEPGVHPGVVIGFNVAESKEGGGGSYATTGSGLTLTYSYTPAGGTTSGERVVITSNGVEYCADSSSGTPIPWSSFAVKCYDTPAGAAFTVGSRITKVAVQLLSSYEAPLTISNFCLTGATVQ